MNLHDQIIGSQESSVFLLIICVEETGASGLGFIVGIWWAENIRKTHGIITFHAYLLSTPEIEGWRDRYGNVIKKR